MKIPYKFTHGLISYASVFVLFLQGCSMSSNHTGMYEGGRQERVPIREEIDKTVELGKEELLDEEIYYEEGEYLEEADVSILNTNVNSEDLINMVEFMQTTAARENLKRVKADIKKVDELWKIGSLRIPTEYDKIVSDQKQKYLNSRRDLFARSNKVNNPPMIEYRNEKLSFFEGRNRFSNLRDMGATYIYLDVSMSSYDIIDKIKFDESEVSK